MPEKVWNSELCSINFYEETCPLLKNKKSILVEGDQIWCIVLVQFFGLWAGPDGLDLDLSLIIFVDFSTAIPLKYSIFGERSMLKVSQYVFIGKVSAYIYLISDVQPTSATLATAFILKPDPLHYHFFWFWLQLSFHISAKMLVKIKFWSFVDSSSQKCNYKQ